METAIQMCDFTAFSEMPKKGFDPEMLLDPFEKEFHLPAAAVQFRDRERWQGKVVGQKDQRLCGFGVLEADAPQRGLEALLRVEAREDNALVANQAGRAINRMRIAALNLEIRLATGHEEAARPVEAIETLEIDEAAIHDIEGARFGQQLVEDIDLVHFAIADVEEGGNIAAQIQQRVQLDGCLG